MAPPGYDFRRRLAESKLMSLVRLLGKPLEVPQTATGWLKDQLPQEETAFLRQSRIELLVPIATSPDRTEALLALGLKRSEEPYSREDLDLLVAIASSLALLLEKPSGDGSVEVIRLRSARSAAFATTAAQRNAPGRVRDWCP